MLLNFDTKTSTPSIVPKFQHDRNSCKMAETPPPKRQKREDYRSAHRADEASTELPRKKFYRQRAHANPFSDHRLV